MDVVLSEVAGCFCLASLVAQNGSRGETNVVAQIDWNSITNLAILRRDTARKLPTIWEALKPCIIPSVVLPH